MAGDPELNLLAKPARSAQGWRKLRIYLHAVINFKSGSNKIRKFKHSIVGTSPISCGNYWVCGGSGGDNWVLCQSTSADYRLEVRRIPDAVQYLDNPFADTWEFEGRFQVVSDKRSYKLPVAVKTLRAALLGKSVNPLDRLLRRFHRELQKTAQLKHPNIAPLLGYHEGATLYDQFLVTPWYPNGNLTFWSKVSRSIEEKYVMIEGISTGLVYLSQMSVVHGDLRSDNILVDDHLNPILVDFGYATVCEEGEALDPTEVRPMAHDASDVKWVSPERLDTQEPSLSDDVYALGCLILYIMTGELPYHTAENPAQFWESRQTEPPSSPRLLPSYQLEDCWWNIMDQCWKPAKSSVIAKPIERRPTIEVVHPLVLDAIDHNSTNTS